MLAKELNEKLTKVGPGTEMGELLRRYWHPIAASRELDDTPFRTKEVRVLGEDLVLFRDRSVHTEWLHSYFGNYVDQIKGTNSRNARTIGATFGRPHRKIAFDEFEYGIIKRRMVEGDTGEEEDWTVGHPILFPNTLLTGSQYSYTMQFRTPIDDSHTLHVSQYIFCPAPGERAPQQP